MLPSSAMLEIWDAGLRRHPVDRALLMLSYMGHDPGLLADLPLGDVNRELLALRRARFGELFEVWADCPDCKARMTLAFSAEDLPPASDTPPEITVGGYRFRRPTSREVALVGGIADVPAAARALASGCALSPADLPKGAELDALLVQVERVLDEADPWADLTMLATCPTCGGESEVGLDIAGIFWDEIAATAQHLLDDVHRLASAYGWSEAEILGLSEARRAAYLARLAA